MTNGKQNNNLTPREQKTTAAYKLLSKQVKILQKSLKSVQNELENYRSKYYDADKGKAVAVSKNSASGFHEFLKFVTSVVFGGMGVNFFTSAMYTKGIIFIIIAIISYGLIVFVDKK